jgi:hypothetical protein
MLLNVMPICKWIGLARVAPKPIRWRPGLPEGCLAGTRRWFRWSLCRWRALPTACAPPSSRLRGARTVARARAPRRRCLPGRLFAAGFPRGRGCHLQSGASRARRSCRSRFGRTRLRMRAPPVRGRSADARGEGLPALRTRSIGGRVKWPTDGLPLVPDGGAQGHPLLHPLRWSAGSGRPTCGTAAPEVSALHPGGCGARCRLRRDGRDVPRV